MAVAGESMAPTFNAGDWLLVMWGGSFRRGQAVIIEREDQPGVFLIKRVVGPIDEKFWVEGDNKNESTDSRHWGAISEDEIVASIVLRFKKAGSRRKSPKKD